MKKITNCALLVSMLLVLCSCSALSNESSFQKKDTEITQDISKEDNKEKTAPIIIKESPDKYTAYVKSYVGRNCASVGYESLGGDRNDYIGNGYIKLVMITENGEFVGIEDEELKEYVVVDQNLSPNTEVKFTYDKDSKGNEYDNIIEWQSVTEIVLKIRKVGSKETVSKTGMTEIFAAPDKYTTYIRDYEGRNLAKCGYISLGGELRYEYGDANLKIVIIADDGSFVEIEEEELAKYFVTAQSPAPNQEVKCKYATDSNGNEYSWTDWQSIEEIELFVLFHFIF